MGVFAAKIRVNFIIKVITIISTAKVSQNIKQAYSKKKVQAPRIEFVTTLYLAT